MKKSKIKKISLAAIFTAVIVASAWLSIPTPFGVNLAFTVFGVSLAAFVLGAKYGIACTIAYILLGAVGLPVFSHFFGGAGVLFGVSGGFLWGFLILAAICGIAKHITIKSTKYLLMISAVVICHALGVVQFCFVTGNNILTAILCASIPFLPKDIAIMLLAHLVSKKIKI